MKSINNTRTRYCLILFCSLSCLVLKAQNFNTDRIELKMFLTRMYESEPFEGVRIVEDYDSCYLLSVLALPTEQYQSQSTMDRVASVKAMSQASRYFNGSEISSDLIIRTSTDTEGHSDIEIIEHIQENSVGYIKQMELLTSFKSGDSKVYIFIKHMNMNNDNENTKKTKAKKWKVT